MGYRTKSLAAVVLVGLITATHAGPALATVQECEFPSQDVPFTNQIGITNFAPYLDDIVTDVCGNIISETDIPSPASLSGSGWTVVQTGDGDYTVTLDIQTLEVPQESDILVLVETDMQVPQEVGDVCFSCT